MTTLYMYFHACIPAYWTIDNPFWILLLTSQRNEDNKVALKATISHGDKHKSVIKQYLPAVVISFYTYKTGIGIVI